MKWLVTWYLDGQKKREEFVYKHNARQWVIIVHWIWKVKATMMSF